MDQPDVLILDVLLLIVLPAVIGYVLGRWLGDSVKRRGWPPLGVRTLRLVIWILTSLVVIGGLAYTLGSYSFLSALTISAIAGIAVTLALQTTFQNILAGIMLIQRQFLHTGDKIQFGGMTGTVVSIGLVEVVIKTDTGALAMISNSNLISGPFVNFTAATRLSGEY